MTEDLRRQISELIAVHKRLINVLERGTETIVSGALPFEASADGFETIADRFEIELAIPDAFPDMLPRVRETAGRIERSYPHINVEGTLCLAIPVEQRRIFFEQRSLLGFVNRLVIPYLYGYCHWNQCGRHPFDEEKHGAEGIVQYYIGKLHLADELAVLGVVCFLYEHGYRGHHPCPCGSGLKVRSCHASALRSLDQHHTSQTICHDFLCVFEVCFSRFQAGQFSFPRPLRNQICRILNKIKG
ncbi:MAG: hypothetical protein H0V34_09195 [Gammaproteobacteria bacterium]|nr:hypothetical protein [Gammaproteobacteria bacterium]